MNRVFFCFWFIQNELDFPTVQFHRASCLILRNKSTQNSQAGCWPEEVEVPRGESLGVRCHKNTTSSVGSCGASGAFLSSPQSCPLLLPVSLTQPVCLPLSCLSPCTPTTQSCACPAPSPLHWEPLCQLWEKKHSLCKENLHFTWECSLHWSRDVWIQSNAPFCLKLIVTIFSLLKIVVSEASSKDPTKENPQKVPC